MRSSKRMGTERRPLLELMRANVTLNDVRNHVRVAAYDWGSPPADLPVDRIEMVLAADCVYFEVRPRVDNNEDGLIAAGIPAPCSNAV